MVNFADMTLVQGLEEILTNPHYQEGQGIVQTLEELVAQRQVKREGKVLTLISERTNDAFERQEATGEQPHVPKPHQEEWRRSHVEDINELIQALEDRLQHFPDNGVQELHSLTQALQSGGHELVFGNAKVVAEQTLDPQVKRCAEQLQQLVQEDSSKGYELLQNFQSFLTQGELPAPSELASAELVALTKRLAQLPERYQQIFAQLLANWEVQVHGARPDKSNPEGDKT